ncbi:MULTISPECIES: hypothetical protein [unclassified Streptomyces]|uniref:hypothetical protein n=1 Tax=unclassified Streptomyces TaxID=2593676 RepID=UPI000FFE807F|nr:MULTISPECIES: hypothetical protein [unclassified Streptomyces]
MSRRPSLPRYLKDSGGASTARVLAAGLATAALLTTAACSDDGGDSGSRASDVAASPLAAQTPTSSPASTPATSPSSSPASSPATSAPARLTEAGARSALITEGDIEDSWNEVKDASKWSDTLLVGKVDVADFLTAKANAADCQKLLDALYSDHLLGKPSGASALRGFQQGDSRLLYQVASYDSGQLNSSLAWLKTLPVKCDQFTATDSKGGKRTVQVTEGSVPAVGDARQDLRVVVQGTANGEATTLTLDVAVVRVGENAITVTAGGLNGAEQQSTAQAVTKGTQRLKDVLSGKTPAAGPAQSH